MAADMFEHDRKMSEETEAEHIVLLVFLLCK